MMQPSLFIALAFLIGLALSVFFVMLAMEKRSPWAYSAPVGFSILVNIAEAVIYRRNFDILGTALLAVALLALAILIVRFEVSRRE